MEYKVFKVLIKKLKIKKSIYKLIIRRLNVDFSLYYEY